MIVIDAYEFVWATLIYMLRNAVVLQKPIYFINPLMKYVF